MVYAGTVKLDTKAHGAEDLRDITVWLVTVTGAESVTTHVVN